MPTGWSSLRLWLAIVGSVCLSGAWSLAIPLLASPDETAHMFTAAAVVDGQINTRRVGVPGLGVQHEVELPTSLTRLEHSADCIVTQPAATAACVGPTAAESGRVGRTQFGRYPPVYYALVGLAGLPFSGSSAARAMRGASALLSGAFLGLGLWLVWRFHRSQLALAACAVALTPAVFGLAGVINPNGLEVAAAFAAWCGLSALVSRGDAPPQLVIGTTTATVALVVARPTSPLWALVALGVASVTMDRARRRAMLHDRVVRRCGLAVGAALIAWAAWTASVGTPTLLGAPPKKRGVASALRVIWDAIPDRTRSLMGNLLAVPAPRWVLIAFGVGLSALAAVIWVRGRCGLVAAVLLGIVAFVAAVVAELAQFDDYGPWWQARYSLPLLVGVPLIMCSTTRVTVSPPVRIGVGAVFVVVQGAVLVWGVHRFGVVPGGGWSPSDFLWRPPHLGAFAGLVIVGGAALWIVFADPPARSMSHGSPGALDRGTRPIGDGPGERAQSDASTDAVDPADLPRT